MSAHVEEWGEDQGGGESEWWACGHTTRMHACMRAGSQTRLVHLLASTHMHACLSICWPPPVRVVQSRSASGATCRTRCKKRAGKIRGSRYREAVALVEAQECRGHCTPARRAR